MIYFIVYLFFEVLISVNLSSAIGSLMTFFEILISAAFGIMILINFRKTLAENMSAVSYNCIDLKQFQSLNLFTIFGAILLILPGFLTDIVGLLMQFSVFTTMLVNRYHVKSGSCKTDFEANTIKKDLDVIDVEIISDNTLSK
ncbi:MAG: FxsA family protein [Epsilonproteobacteria bacterium]|nr:FxsA family protein [Campylobacterota bacterium]OIO13700.1 MAG: FxsA protein [Helicobacteraceae bacterium CG1_02_36_14]PIP10649.1 MAG: FxsA protein [Sulfurimonas sp. CG23_combo_of_CG06-09_8_20_14_all_36_33]PIS25622.1 MAG: FxsA protein [Sulfurimonas sp. CG08_land_8_20_14_0_20_36_33]PIU34929.1 MAG: FxsA protein [Sulfurimonas sp. CG07_land_8_20_14_0_80_36_56]PIV04642.1 MAG: FxsA protein [Sulfurimonas sp. CG03_land_8_20_14_0_80_36_25]PIV36419.1 MAG: FxsA protein [Sulfurimonas sp. CG02_land_8_2